MTIVEQGSGPAPQAIPDLIKETTTQTFVKDVIEESRRQPVLIDFWAPWCGPCRQLTPVLEKAVRAAKGRVKLVKMNIDEHPAIPGQMGIQSIPAVIAFVGGQPADGFMGAIPESQVNAFIEKLTRGVPAIGEPNIADILKEAEAVLAEGDPAGAAQIYAEALGRLRRPCERLQARTQHLAALAERGGGDAFERRFCGGRERLGAGDDAHDARRHLGRRDEGARRHVEQEFRFREPLNQHRKAPVWLAARLGD